MPSAVVEARSLVAMVRNGASEPEEIRSLINIAPADAIILQKCLCPGEFRGYMTDRQAVLREFERLIQASRHVATCRNRKVASQFGQSKQVKERELKITKQQNPHSVTDENEN
jgi:hypothetical protein